VNPVLVLHVGQHKTGSKALQSFLAHNRIALRLRGIEYPLLDPPRSRVRAYEISHFRLYALIRREAIHECYGKGAAARYWQQQSRHCLPFDSALSFFQALDAEVRRSGLHRVVVSAEDLFDMHTAHEVAFRPQLIEAGARRIAALASDFGHDVRVVVYLRRQDHLLAAHYAQFIKGGVDHDIDFEEFARAFAPRLDTHHILGTWAQVFGPDRVCVRRYERSELPGGIVPDFFDHALGLPVPDFCVQPAADAESVNRTPDRDFVEFIRILNRRSAAGQSVLPRDAVLAAALRSDPAAHEWAGASAWLSPRARREVLEAHQEGNAAIARDFLRRMDGRLFIEPWPEDSQSWQPYPGLSPDQALAIAQAVQGGAPASRAGDPEAGAGGSIPARVVRRLRDSFALLRGRD